MTRRTDVSIVTARLELRPFRVADIPRIHAVLYADAKARRLTGGVATLAETTRTIEAYIAWQTALGYSYQAVLERETGDLVGEAGLKPLAGEGPEVELGYAFAPGWWGRGYATEAACAVLDHAWRALGLERVVAVTRERNLGSRRVLQKLGFVASGRRRVYGDDLLGFELDRPDP